MHMEMTRNISIYNNAFYECRKNGLRIYLDNNIFFIENNVIMGVYERDDIDPSESCLDYPD